MIGQRALVPLAHPMLRYPKTAWQGAVDGQSTTAQARVARAAPASAAPASAGITFHDAGVDFLEAVERGSALDRYGRPFTDESLSELRWHQRRPSVRVLRSCPGTARCDRRR